MANPVGNQITNPGAEANTGSPPTAWTVSGPFESVPYGTSGGFPDANSPGCPSRGNNFFSGGSASVSTASQTVDLSASGSDFDAGNVYAHLVGYLGGWQNDDDNMVVEAIFRNQSMTELGRFQIGPVLAADRGNVTGMLLRAAAAAVPVGTRFVEVLQTATRSLGSYNDGYSDCLALTFNNDPTAITLLRLGATQTPSGVVVRWRTAAATRVAGFHLFRQEGAGRHRLTKSLIRASFVGAGAPYRFLDRSARRSGVTYWLQAVGLDGSRAWVGSTAPA